MAMDFTAQKKRKTTPPSQATEAPTPQEMMEALGIERTAFIDHMLETYAPEREVSAQEAQALKDAPPYELGKARRG